MASSAHTTKGSLFFYFLSLITRSIALITPLFSFVSVTILLSCARSQMASSAHTTKGSLFFYFLSLITRSIALITPLFSFVSVTILLKPFTSSVAFPIAIGNPAY